MAHAAGGIADSVGWEAESELDWTVTGFMLIPFPSKESGPRTADRRVLVCPLFFRAGDTIREKIGTFSPVVFRDGYGSLTVELA